MVAGCAWGPPATAGGSALKAVLSVLELLAASALGRASAGLIGLQRERLGGMGARFAPGAFPAPLARRDPVRDGPVPRPAQTKASHLRSNLLKQPQRCGLPPGSVLDIREAHPNVRCDGLAGGRAKNPAVNSSAAFHGGTRCQSLLLSSLSDHRIISTRP